MTDPGVVTPDKNAESERRAPVQGNGHPRSHAKYKPPGTVAWWEHEKAWQDYTQRYWNDQSADVIAQRGGFSHWELTDHLGHEPETWQPREAR